MTTTGRTTCPTCGGPWNGDSERFRVSQPVSADPLVSTWNPAPRPRLGLQSLTSTESRDLATVLETVP